MSLNNIQYIMFFLQNATALSIMCTQRKSKQGWWKQY